LESEKTIAITGYVNIYFVAVVTKWWLWEFETYGHWYVLSVTYIQFWVTVPCALLL